MAAASTMAETTASEAETTAGSELKASVANAAADKARLSSSSVSSAGDGSDSKPEVVKAGQSSGTASLSLHPLCVHTLLHPLCTPTLHTHPLYSHTHSAPTLHPLCTHSAPIPHPLSYADSLLDASQHSVMSLDDSEDGGSSARADASWHGGNSMFGAPFLK